MAPYRYGGVAEDAGDGASQAEIFGRHYLADLVESQYKGSKTRLDPGENYRNFMRMLKQARNRALRDIDKCRIVELPKITDPRGNLSFIEGGDHVPFDIKRVYYLYDVPGGAHRGSHAHRNLHQFIVAMSGSFDIVLNDGQETRRFQMTRSYYGLYVCPMMWRDLDNFSSGAVCMVLASEHFSKDDYIRDYDEFRTAAIETGRLLQI